MLRQTFAGRIDRMGRVEKPKTLERAPRYEYNPGNISGAHKSDQGLSQSQLITLPHA